ncbi:hypothetical protein IM793_17060 [Pedobacter sp. MR2016-19]|uniref:hypothetical protein n=1 Tax=Pedobacter sp. MR2016-19 TaxID=2780089 RepID=UPI00187585B2|nr:hypothetical protein [Pedobacter sp. MR2016-19]MBE5320879.1 hypothetical protein [Pedobacter sp. MR2016-19]
MKKAPSYKAIAFLISLFVFSGCHKDNLTKSITVKSTTKDVPNYYFNWETASNMPVAGSSPVVSLPWQSQSGNYIDPSLVSDYKSNDGWELVYNTFNPNVIATAANQPAGGLYFALYNRYRGIIRYYLYIPTGLFGNSSSIEHGLSTYSDNSTSSKMLNFDGVDIVDPSISTPSFVKTNNQGVAVGGGWYSMQYEIGYDPAFADTTYPHLGFTWNSKTVNISQIALNGTNVGTLNGNITQPSSGFDLAGTLINGIVGAAEIYGTVATAGAASGTFLSGLGGAAAGGLAGNVTGFLSGIFGGNSNNSQEVDLKMNSTISLNGTLSGSQPLVPNSLVFPGQSVANTIGAPVPLIGHALGVFNLSARPTVNVHTTRQSVLVNEGGQNVPYNQYSIQYTVNSSIFNSLVQQNTSVINSSATGASIQNLTYQVVMINPNTGYNFNANATHENIGSLSVYTGSSVTLQYLAEHSLPVNNTQVAVRVSFNVVPNNGAPSSLIVKSFVANLVNN